MLNKLKEVYRTVAEGKEAALTFTADGEEYLRSFHPPERLILLGCGNIGQELCRYAADLGFTVTAVDERPAFANRTLMPDAAPAAIALTQTACGRSCPALIPAISA